MYRQELYFLLPRLYLGGLTFGMLHNSCSIFRISSSVVEMPFVKVGSNDYLILVAPHFLCQFHDTVRMLPRPAWNPDSRAMQYTRLSFGTVSLSKPLAIRQFLSDSWLRKHTHPHLFYGDFSHKKTRQKSPVYLHLAQSFLDFPYMKTSLLSSLWYVAIHQSLCKFSISPRQIYVWMIHLIASCFDISEWTPL